MATNFLAAWKVESRFETRKQSGEKESHNYTEAVLQEGLVEGTDTRWEDDNAGMCLSRRLFFNISSLQQECGTDIVGAILVKEFPKVHGNAYYEKNL